MVKLEQWFWFDLKLFDDFDFAYGFDHYGSKKTNVTYLWSDNDRCWTSIQT